MMQESKDIIKENQPIETTTALKSRWKFPYEDKIKKFAKEKPKKAFYIMCGLVVLSFFITIGKLIYTQKVLVPQYEALQKESVFKDGKTTLGAPIEATQRIMEVKDVLKELDYYKKKSVLTKSDSLRIEYLIDKYKKHGSEKN